MSKGWKYWDNDFREWKEVEPDYLDTIFDGEITTNRFDMNFHGSSGSRCPRRERPNAFVHVLRVL